MIVSFKFFDKEEWSLYATLQTLIPLIIYYLGFGNINNIPLLTLSSLIAMMQGELLNKLIFSFFLSMLIWKDKKLILGSILTLLATYITSIIPRNNKIYNYILNNKYLKNLIKLSIICWFIVFVKSFKNYL